MSILNSISNASLLPQVASKSIPASQLGSFEINSREFGPVAAGAIGAAQTVRDAGQTLYSFSAAGLDKLSQAASEAGAAVGEGLGDAVELASDGVAAITGGLTQLAEVVEQTASEVAGTVSRTSSEVVDSVESAASQTLDTLAEASSTVAGYAALGIAAGEQLVNELV